jgi:hypothetical protein
MEWLIVPVVGAAFLLGHYIGWSKAYDTYRCQHPAPRAFDVESVQLLHPRPGDVVVFCHPKHLTEDARERIGDSWRQVTRGTEGEGVPAMVLEEGMRVQGVVQRKH